MTEKCDGIVRCSCYILELNHGINSKWQFLSCGTIALHSVSDNITQFTCTWWHRLIKSNCVPNCFATLVLEGGGWSVPPFGHLIPGKDLVPFSQEAQWALGLVSTGRESFTLIRIQPQDCPACSKLLYYLLTCYVEDKNSEHFLLHEKRNIQLISYLSCLLLLFQVWNICVQNAYCD